MEKQPVIYTIYRPKAEVIGAVEIVHGMMEHRRRYDYLAQCLCEAGFAVITYDQRGHGETASSKEELGYFAQERGWKLLIDDCRDINELMRKEFPGVPLILLGHSMGTLVARSFLKRYDAEIDALILSGAPNYNPMASLGKKLAGLIGKIRGSHYRSKLLRSMVLGPFNRQISSPRTDCDWLSKNPDNVDEYIKDPFCHFNFTASAYEDLMFGIMDMADLLRWNLRNPDLPILFVAGEEDPCTGKDKGLDDSVHRLHEAGYHNVERIVYSGLRHELFHEKEKDSIIRDLIRWMKQSIEKKQ